jgi:decaprenylphosphoryl-5-phosphoribose phosphatase
VENADLTVLRALRTRWHTPAIEQAMRLIGKAGNNAAIWFGVNIVLAVLDSSQRQAWLICAALGPVAIGLNYAIKLIVKRPRPVLDGLPPLGGAPSSLSFPSAHATSSFAVATAMTRVDSLGALAFVLALALSLGRPYLGMHYPSDVIAGAAIGAVLGFVVPLSL